MCLQLFLLGEFGFDTGAGGGEIRVGGRLREASETQRPCEGERDLEHLQ